MGQMGPVCMGPELRQNRTPAVRNARQISDPLRVKRGPKHHARWRAQTAAFYAFDIYDTDTQAMSSNYVQLTDGHGEYRPVPLPVRVASRTRPDGPLRRVTTARAVGRVDAGTIHEREPPARLNLGEARRLAARLGTPRDLQPPCIQRCQRRQRVLLQSEHRLLRQALGHAVERRPI
jgi:hypothetical protein